MSSYFLFGERDASEHPDRYTRPDFWLYYPTDQRIPFDQPTPSCRTDYLTAFLQWIGIGRPGSEVAVSPLWISAPRVRPGSVLTLGGQVAHNGGRTFQAELLQDGVPIARAIFNCQAGAFLGEYQIPATTRPGPQTFAARLMTPDGQIIPVAEAQVEIDPDAPPPPRVKGAQPSQPTPDAMIALNPTLPVADRGRTYVIFDLRGLYRDR